VFHVVIGCAHEISLSKTLRDGQLVPGTNNTAAVTDIEYQLVTLPRLTSLLHGYAAVAGCCNDNLS